MISYRKFEVENYFILLFRSIGLLAPPKIRFLKVSTEQLMFQIFYILYECIFKFF